MVRHRRTNSWRMRRKRVGWRLYVLRRRLTFASRRADRHAGRLAPLAEPVRVPDAPLPAELQDLDPSLAELAAAPSVERGEYRRRRADRATFALALVLVLGVIVITVARDSTDATSAVPMRALRTPDELGILLGVEPLRTLARGIDRFTVVSCRISGPGTHPSLPATSALAGRLDAEIAPLLARLSGGRYRPEFVGGETAAVSATLGAGADATGETGETGGSVGGGEVGEGDRTPGDPGEQCAAAAAVRSSGANATIVVTDDPSPNSSAGIDLVSVFAGARTLPASGRRVVVPIGALDDPAGLVRRIGRTLGWPASPPNPGELATAFDRWASGWIDPRDVVVHTGGTRTIRLGLPRTGATEFVSIASPRIGRSTSIEVITNDPLSPGADASGVRVVAVDHDAKVCPAPIAGVCGGPLRREADVAVGTATPGVLRPGEAADIGDVHVEVGRPDGPYLDVRLTGGTGPANVLTAG